MSAEESKTVVRRCFAALDAGDRATLDQLIPPDYRFQMAGMPGPLDREAFYEFVAAFYRAFPDLRHDIEDQAAEGERVFTRMTVRGTHQGDFQGIAPTGRRVAVSAMNGSRVVDGRIVETYGLFDALGLLQQLGAIPAPAH